LYQEGNIMSIRASSNGTSAAEMEFEATHYTHPEWEDEAALFGTPEMEYEHQEWEDEATHFSTPEMTSEWEDEAALFGTPEMEYEHQEWEGETDAFLPFIPLAMGALKSIALPALKRVAVTGIKRLLPVAKKVAGNVASNILKPASPASRPQTPQSVQSRNRMLSSLFYQLGNILAQGESEAETIEAQLFGANEFESEIAAHELAHEAALTEVMAAEAAHTESLSEAEAVLNATLPITIRIMGGQRALRRVTPALVKANTQLVRSLHQQDRPIRQLVRTAPTINRRVIGSLKAIKRAGHPITPALVSGVMAGQAARVLGTPQITGRALVRNVAIRKGTVARPRPGQRSCRIVC
jgi:hypothetical protein